MIKIELIDKKKHKNDIDKDGDSCRDSDYR